MEKALSDQLEAWLTSKQPKTIQGLIEAFGEKSFAIVILVLMFLPALPIPTGGITHIFELVVMLLAIEMLIGRRAIWLPKFMLRRPLGKTLEKRTIPFIVRRVRWFERRLQPRYRGIVNNRLTLMFSGALFFVLALAAALAPPFSGLDTFPALGAVILALALILEDALALAAAIGLSLGGIVLVVMTGSVTFHYIRHLFGA
jgi:hypothetical protein